MRLPLIILAGALIVTTSAVAQNTATGSAPSDISAAKKKIKKVKMHQKTPGSGAEAGMNNSTGNMNTKGTGKGTTGTGGPGGSGNR
jgi:hypothetical protein